MQQNLKSNYKANQWLKVLKFEVEIHGCLIEEMDENFLL